MKKIFMFTLILALFFPLAPSASPKAQVKAAFIRDGNVWILKDGEEKQVTSTGKVMSKPQWSKDGKWIVYQMGAPSKFTKGEQQSEVWIYNIETNEKKKIFYDGYAPKWAPHKNVIAFNSKGILDVSNFKQFYNIATGVNDYTWLPDGTGFLLSSSGTLRPDGWSSATLFTKKVGDNYQDIVLFGGVEPFFTLPRELGSTDKNKLIAVYAEQLTYSPSGKWISFVVTPTASWSMDSNMVCVIGSDGKNFEVLDEIILQVGEPKWAPSTDTIAFIAGGGRIVMGFKNKKLKIKEMPASGTLTPSHFADLDFNWMTDNSLVVSRVKEKEWTNDLTKHPLPVLYSIDVPTKKQTKITHPPKGSGDYSPQYIPSIEKLVWLRGKEFSQNKVLWKANADGTEAKEWLKNVDDIVFYSSGPHKEP